MQNRFDTGWSMAVFTKVVYLHLEQLHAHLINAIGALISEAHASHRYHDAQADAEHIHFSYLCCLRRSSSHNLQTGSSCWLPHSTEYRGGGGGWGAGGGGAGMSRVKHQQERHSNM